MTMKENPRLKQMILEVVNNQLKANNPPVTRKTLQRLTKKYDEKTAKEMIASVLLEEMYYVLKDKQVFNDKRYAEKSNNLK